MSGNENYEQDKAKGITTINPVEFIYAYHSKYTVNEPI